MGIYDRDYYRREGPSYIGSFMERGKVCKWLILINVGCYLLQAVTTDVRHTREARPISDGEDQFESVFVPRQPRQPFTEAMRLDAPAVLHGQIWRLLTYAFMHAGIMHIAFNMLFLWWFGTDVEDLYGPVEFLTMYLTAAVIAGLAFVGAWKAGFGDFPFCVGASGAIMAVVVICAFHYPTRIIWIFGLVPVPIWLFVLFAVLKDWTAFVSHEEAGIAVTAHLGGAAFGAAYYKFHWRLSSLFSGWRTAVRRSRPRARLRVYREEEEGRPAPLTVPPTADVDEQLEAKLDAILEKVARSGQGSLTEPERQLLLRASEVYKRRKT
jgi:membrane associated rhomboid family serine protease